MVETGSTGTERRHAPRTPATPARLEKAALVAAIVLVGVGGWLSLRRGAEPGAAARISGASASTTSSDVTPIGPPRRERRLFLYSVIPGGVESAAELKRAVASDPVVASHYGGFDVAKAHVIRLAQSRSAYVSYRLGDSVYWTARQITLPKGETVLTDGKQQVRTRCGNRISETPAAPVSPKEPSAETMDAGLLPDPILWAADDPGVPATITPPPLPPLLTAPNEQPLAGIVPPPYFPILGGGGGSSGSNPPPPPAPPPPVVSTPEPSTLALLFAGISLFAVASFIGRYCRQHRG